MSDQEWIFVIDTEQYSGNFERDMCAFMTGMIGQCGVGVQPAQAFYEQTGLAEAGFQWNGVIDDATIEDLRNPFANFIMFKDEEGCARPTSIWPTSNWFNNGMGNFREGQEKEALADHREKCLELSLKFPHQAGYEEEWKTKAEKPLKKFPAFLSVAIFFNKEPTEEMCNMMINRAKAYVGEYCPSRENPWDQHKITITGFRLLKEETIQTLEEQWEK